MDSCWVEVIQKPFNEDGQVYDDVILFDLAGVQYVTWWTYEYDDTLKAKVCICGPGFGGDDTIVIQCWGPKAAEVAKSIYRMLHARLLNPPVDHAADRLGEGISKLLAEMDAAAKSTSVDLV